MVHNYHNTRLNATFGVTISASRLRRSFPLFQSQPQKCPNGEDVLADLALKIQNQSDAGKPLQLRWFLHLCKSVAGRS